MGIKTPVVLIIENDVDVSEQIADVLRESGVDSILAGTGLVATEVLARNRFSALLLDLGIPDISGFSVLQQVRSFSNIPVIVMTEAREDYVKDSCMKAGANDFVSKPFDFVDLGRRIRFLIPSLPDHEEKPVIVRFTTGTLTVNLDAGTVFLDSRQVHLSFTEYRILSCLVRNRGQFVTSETLLKSIWLDESYYEDAGILRVNVTRLRRKLNDTAESPKYIRTEPGRGYCIITRG